MDTALLTVLVVSIVCGILIVIIKVKSEVLAFMISIFGTIGIIFLLYQYLLPQIEKINDPMLTLAFWLGSLIFLITFVFLVWFTIRQARRWKEKAKAQEEELKHYRKMKK